MPYAHLYANASQRYLHINEHKEFLNTFMLSIPSIKILRNWSGKVWDRWRRLLIHLLWFPSLSLCLYLSALQRSMSLWDLHVRWYLSRSEQISHLLWLECLENLTQGRLLDLRLGPKSFLIISQKVEYAICADLIGVSCCYIWYRVVTVRKLGQTNITLSGELWQ